MQARRVVKLTFGTRSAGSGYLLTDRHVLTARHVVDPEERGARCSIAPVDAKALDGTAAWLSEQHDFAIVRATKPGWAGLPPAPAEFGEMAEAPFPQAQARGFPDAAGDRDHPITARVIRVFEPRQLLNVEVQGAHTLKPEWWAGFSGAVVFAGDRPVGVTRKVDLNFNGLLTATPIEALLEEESFAQFWRAEGLTIPRLVPVVAGGGISREDVLIEVANNLFSMDRETPIGEIQQHIRQLHEHRSCVPQIIAVPGVDDDMLQYTIEQLARNEKIQLLLANAGQQTDVIAPLPWPHQEREISPDGEFHTILTELHRRLHLPPPESDAEPDAAMLRKTLDQDGAPRGFFVHVCQAVALGGYGVLLLRLIEFWTGLGSGKPVLLFLCMAMDKPRPPPRERSPFGQRRTLVGENLEKALTGFVEPSDTSASVGRVRVKVLTEIGPKHVERWTDKLSEGCPSLSREFKLLRLRLNGRLEQPKRLRAVERDIDSIYRGA